MSNKKPTITIAIPAYNEAANIGNVLTSLKNQKYRGVVVRNIIVYTDGSTDTTVDVVKKAQLDFPILKLKQGRKQLGKFPRLNQIYKDNTSDVLIVLDADIALENDHFIQHFSESILHDKEAMLVSAHEVPIIPTDFVGRIIASSYTMWDYIRWSIPKYDHVQNLYARATAYRGTFSKDLYIPDKATEERLYLYLMAKKTNGYRYTRKAVIYYLPVSTIEEYIKLSDRAFGRPQPAVNKLVGYDATYLYPIERKYKIRGILTSLLHDPFYTILGMGLGFWLGRTTLSRHSADSAIWEVSLSSKKPIIHNL